VGNADSTGQVCTIVFHVAYSQNMVENQTVRPESCSEKTLRFGICADDHSTVAGVEDT
jgi:hypothetical protein